MLKHLNVSTKAVLVLLFILLPLQAFSQSNNSDVFDLDETISQLKKIYFPIENYQVDVTQQLLNSSLKQSGGNNSDLTINRSYSPDKGLLKISKNSDTSQVFKNTPKVFVDINTYIISMETYNSRFIRKDIIDGVDYILLEGATENNEQMCRMWIDIEDYSIKNIHLYINGKLFATIDITNIYIQDKYYLPQEIVLTHATDNSRVILKFDNYQIEL